MARQAEISSDSVIIASSNQISADLSGEAAILHLSKGLYYGLDAVGSSIWALIQKPRGVEEILKALTAEYDVDLERCRRDLLELLDQLYAEGLIRVVDGKDTSIR